LNFEYILNYQMGNSTTRESLRDKGYDGSDYLSDPALKDGPL